jgi:hypothetical protein
MTDGEAPKTAPETPPTPAPAPARPSWRKHPLARRLPVLLLAALGFWLWKVTGTPTREMVWQFDGYGWGDVRAIDFQVMGPDGKLVEREERMFGPTGPPVELKMEWSLPAGTYRTLLFVKLHNREPRTQLVDTLTVGDEEYIVRRLRLPASR